MVEYTGEVSARIVGRVLGFPFLVAGTHAMWTTTRRTAATLVGGLALLSLAAPARAQFNPGFNYRFYYNTNGLPTRLQLRQSSLNPAYSAYVANQGAFLAAANPLNSPAFIPPVAPIVPPLFSPAYNPYSAYATAAAVNPYASYGGGAAGVNHYSASGAFDPSAFNPYSPWGGYGGLGDFSAGNTLRGVADVLRAAGKVNIDLQQANMMQQEVFRSKFKTYKEAIETQKWIEENTPTETDRRVKIANDQLKGVLKGVKSNAEVHSGSSMRIILDNLAKNSSAAAPKVDSMFLEDDILKHLNVTTPRGGNLGILRNDGKLTWPAAFLDPDVVPEELRTTIDKLTQSMYQQALEGRLKASQVSLELEPLVDKLQASLKKKVNDIPTGQYLEASRFIRELNEAIQGLKNGVGAAVGEYQRYIRGGKTAQQVAEFMNSRGLVFAPATPGDEAAYQAANQGLANLLRDLFAQRETAKAP
jgi:hypothetical protein